MIDWKCIRYAQKELCIRKRISFSKFKEEWVKFFGPPRDEHDRKFLEGSGIEAFYEDYLTSTEPDLETYFKKISE